MTHTIEISEASIYVGTYHKYNEGSIYGEWLLLSNYADREEFYEACRELHKDEDDPEFMFQDYENIPEGLISECWMSDNLFEVLDALNGMEDRELTPFLIWCDHCSHKLASEDIFGLISSFQEDYIGEYESDEDFAREEVEETLNLSDFLLIYFDYEAYARDLFCGSYWSEEGYVFRN